MKCEYSPAVLDHLRRMTTEQADEIKKLKHEIEIERARRFRAEQQLAIKCGDAAAFARATADLMSCCVSIDELEAA